MTVMRRLVMEIALRDEEELIGLALLGRSG